MQFQVGKNPEYTLNLFSDLTFWALPLSVSWYHDRLTKGEPSPFKGHTIPISGYTFYVIIKILCFGFSIECWEWKE